MSPDSYRATAADSVDADDDDNGLFPPPPPEPCAFVPVPAQDAVRQVGALTAAKVHS